jgi:hypothetical protein
MGGDWLPHSRDAQIAMAKRCGTGQIALAWQNERGHLGQYGGKFKKAGLHRPMPLEAYRAYSDLGGELYTRQIQYRRDSSLS